MIGEDINTVEPYDLWRDECGEQYILAWKEFCLAVLNHNDYYKDREDKFLRHVIQTAKYELKKLLEKEEKEGGKKPPNVTTHVFG